MDFSLKALKELLGISAKETPFNIGDKLFIRTVTYHITGKVKEIKGDFIKLGTAAWIADSGRFADALKSESFSEVEPYKNFVWVNINSITDFTTINNLPESQK